MIGYFPCFLHELEGQFHGLIGGLVSFDHFHKGDEEGWKPEMGSDDPALILRFGRNVRDADDGRIGCQNRIEGTDLVQLFEKVLLDLQIFGHRFDDHRGVLDRLLQVRGDLDSACDGLDFRRTGRLVQQE